MSAVRSILVHADATAPCAARLRAATRLAEQHAASATALFAVMPSLLMYPFTIAYTPEAVPLMREFEADRRDRAKKLFDQACIDAAGAAASRLLWAETTEEPVRAFTRRAFCADLLVLGQPDPAASTAADVPADFVASVLVGSGKPALVLPCVGAPEVIGSVALVAWKASRESARALAASLPLLQRAGQVHVAIWDEESPGDEPAPGLEAWLASHGVQATFHSNGRATADIGQYLLSIASDLGADLLVMGCYGHSRSREWVLGGATRSVLASMTLPVLMVH